MLAILFQPHCIKCICRYREALLSLVTHLLQKLQFRHNQSQLEAMDDETLDDDVRIACFHDLHQLQLMV